MKVAMTRTRRASKATDRDRGVSLVEVIISFAVLLLVLVPAANLLVNVIGQTADARDKLTAIGIAEQWLEKLNNSGPPTPGGIPTTATSIDEGPVTQSGVTYHVSAEFNWTTYNSNPDLCSSHVAPELLLLQVTVGWGPGGTGGYAHSLIDTTMINFPPAALPKNGFLGVQLVGDPAGTIGSVNPPPPEPNDVSGIPWTKRVTFVPVTATLLPITSPPTTYTFYPQNNGCAFTEVPPGNYDIQVGPAGSPPVPETFTASGGLGASFQSYSAPFNPVTVSVNEVTAVGPYQYDEGSYINIAFPNSTVTEGGITCPNVAKLQCIVTGQAPESTSSPNTSPVATLSVLSGTWTSMAMPVSMSALESSDCTPSLCLSVGYGPLSGGGYQGAAIYASSSQPTSWAPSPLPSGVENLSQVTCPNSTTCIAIGSGSNGAPVVLAGTVAGSSLSWVEDALPSNVASLSQITCSGTTACLAIGSTGNTAVVISASATPGFQTWVEDALPSNVASLSQITCSGTTACLAIGSNTATPSLATVVAGSVSPTTQTWVQDALPSNVASLSQITCSGTTACLAIGSTSSGATIVSGGVTTTSTTWAQDSLPTASATQSPMYFSGVGCFSSSSGSTTCAAPGASETSALLLSDPTLSVASNSWSDSSASLGNLTGLYASGLPISLNSTELPSFFVACGPGTCPGSIGPLFPFASGYEVSAANCQAESTNASQAPTVPGANGGSAATAVPPLGVVPIQVVSSSGAPVVNASVTLKVNDPSATGASCNDGTTYALSPTNPDGITSMATMYETYSVTVNGSQVATVTVSPLATTIQQGSSKVRVPLPEPVRVVLS